MPAGDYIKISLLAADCKEHGNGMNLTLDGSANPVFLPNDHIHKISRVDGRVNLTISKRSARRFRIAGAA